MYFKLTATTKSKFTKITSQFLVVLSFLFLSFSAGATDYYFSASGSDSYSSTQAQSQSTPWQSISKLNSYFSSLKAGDNVYFKRGDIFYGTLTINKSGNTSKHILLSAYGSGNKPVITGFTTVSGWTNEGAGIYSKSISSAAQTNMVTINGVQYGMGRYPDDTYLIYEAASSTTSITDNELTSATNWTGAEAVIRKNDWNIERCTITSHNGNTIYYKGRATSESASPNYGYFIQNDLRTLTRFGEWYHNTGNGKFYMYFGSVDPNSTTVKVATVNNLLSFGGNDYITVDNISFSGSIDNEVAFGGGNNDCYIQYSDFYFCGKMGVAYSSGSGFTFDNNTIVSCNGSGITSDGTSSVITNNTILNIGNIKGQTLAADGSNGIGITGNGSSVKFNTLRNIGASGVCVKYTGTITVQNNYIDTICNTYDDGGGIYTSGDNTSARIFDHNIILHAIGNSDGTNNTVPLSSGIFLDESASNVTISNNTIASTPYCGIKFHKANRNTITGNTIYDNAQALFFQNTTSASTIYGNSLSGNILFAKTASQYPFRIASNVNDVSSFGTSDNNFFLRPIDDNLTMYVYQPSIGYVFKTLAGWQTLVNQDWHSKKSPKSVTSVDQLNFQYNPSSSSKVVSFSGLSYMDAAGTVYNNSATIPAWGSLVLIANGTAVTANKPPVANAGPDVTITLPIIVVTLTGSGTDVDGRIAAYNWKKIAGPALGSILTPLGAITIITSLGAGSYQYELTVTDDDGLTDKDTVNVTVNNLLGGGSGTLLDAVNPANTGNGLDYKYYEGDWAALPTFSALTPVKAGTVSTFDISSANRSTQYAFNFSGYINVPADGQYTFYTSSDDGSSLFIDNIQVVSNDGEHSTDEKSGTIGLKAGKHAISGLYFQQGGDEVFDVSYQSSGISKRVIPASALYRINDLLPAVYPSNTVNGLDYKYYEGSWVTLPAFSSLNPVSTGTVSTVTLSVPNRTNQFGLSFTGYINVPSDGYYTFYMYSDDGSKVLIDNQVVVTNDGVHSPSEKTGVIGLMAGKHAVTVYYFQQLGEKALRLSYSSDKISKTEVPAANYFRVNNVGSRTATRTNGAVASGVAVNAITNGTTDINASGSLKISSYPNPSTTEFGLYVQGGSNEKIEVSVTSVDGKTMFKATGTSNKKYNFGNSFQPGLYIIKVIQGNTVQTLKVVKG